MTTLPTRLMDSKLTRSETTPAELVDSNTTSFASPPETKPIMFSREATFTGSTSLAEFKGQGGTGAKPISIDVLYQAREAGSRNFNRAIELLGLASESLSEARDAIGDNDRVACASELMRFEQLLQPLFECREIGDGFANVINTIHIAIANRNGEPLTDVQINTLWRIVRTLLNGPFLNFSESLVFVRDLSKVGLGLNNSFFQEWASESSTVGTEQSVR